MTNIRFIGSSRQRVYHLTLERTGPSIGENLDPTRKPLPKTNYQPPTSPTRLPCDSSDTPASCIPAADSSSTNPSPPRPPSPTGDRALAAPPPDLIPRHNPA